MNGTYAKIAETLTPSPSPKKGAGNKNFLEFASPLFSGSYGVHRNY